MHRLFTVISALILSLASQGVSADNDVETMASAGPHDAFFAVVFDGDRGLSVGAAGALLATSDAGRTWLPEAVPTQQALLGVGMSGDHAIVVGQAGLILRRGEDGWQPAESGTPERLMNVAVNTSGTAAAVGAFGTVLVSEDAGATWHSRPPDWSRVTEVTGGMGGLGPNLYAVHVSDAGAITIAGEWGVVMRSSDAGSSWSILHAGNVAEQERDASLFGMHVGPDGLIIVVGQSGTVHRSEDDGASWTTVPTDSFSNLLSITAASNQRMVATGMREMLVSDDGGLNWQRLDASDFMIGWYSGAAAPAGSHAVYVVGHSGRIVAISGKELRAASTDGVMTKQ